MQLRAIVDGTRPLHAAEPLFGGTCGARVLERPGVDVGVRASAESQRRAGRQSVVRAQLHPAGHDVRNPVVAVGVRDGGFGSTGA